MCCGGARCRRRWRQAAAVGGDSNAAAAVVLEAKEVRAAGGGAASPAPRRPCVGGGCWRRQEAAPRRLLQFSRPRVTGTPRGGGAAAADGGSDLAAATLRRCLGTAGRRRATARRRRRLPAAMWRAAPAVGRRREAPPQHVPRIWLVACQSLIGTQLDQQICIRHIVLKHIPKMSGKCISQIMPETGLADLLFVCLGVPLNPLYDFFCIPRWRLLGATARACVASKLPRSIPKKASGQNRGRTAAATKHARTTSPPPRCNGRRWRRWRPHARKRMHLAPLSAPNGSRPRGGCPGCYHPAHKWSTNRV